MAFHQTGDVETGGIERLQDVVARRSEEAGLGDVRLFGLALGAAELRIEASQFFGALLHPPLQRLIGALELLRGLHAGSNVRKSRDDATVRHRIGTHFHDQVALGEALQKRLAAVDVTAELLTHERISSLLIGRALLGMEAHNVVERSANPSQLRGQRKDLPELPIPANEKEILVEYRDALAHLVERGLQDLTVVMNGGVGIVEQLERRLGRYRAFTQQEREHQAGRCCADRRREQMLGIAQELEIRLRLGIYPDAARQGIAVEGAACTLLAEVARYGCRQFFHRYRGAPEPEARRDRC